MGGTVAVAETDAMRHDLGCLLSVIWLGGGVVSPAGVLASVHGLMALLDDVMGPLDDVMDPLSGSTPGSLGGGQVSVSSRREWDDKRSR